tara:strand:+ start:236 stop:667 length:432 start_codon:yes stop_codon:yes gene_type:complete
VITHSKYRVEAKGLTVRPYRPSDAPALRAMMEAEGVREDEMGFGLKSTVVLLRGDEIQGFFTLNISRGYPHLQHFCMAGSHRWDQSGAWRLIRSARRAALFAGYGRMIVHARGNRLTRLVRAYFRAMPYYQAEDGTAFFFVGV